MKQYETVYDFRIFFGRIGVNYFNPYFNLNWTQKSIKSTLFLCFINRTKVFFKGALFECVLDMASDSDFISFLKKKQFEKS